MKTVIVFPLECFVIATYTVIDSCNVAYHIAGKFGGEKVGEFGELSVICQTKTIQIFTYNYYLMAESIHSPNFSSPNVHNSEFAKLFHRQTFPLYGI